MILMWCSTDPLDEFISRIRLQILLSWQSLSQFWDLFWN